MVSNPDKKSEVPVFKKVVRKFRHGLVLQSIRNQLARIGLEILPYYWVQEGMNITETPKIKGMVSDYTVAFLGPEDIKRIGVDPWGISVDIQLADLKAGKKCLGLKHNGEIAAFMWINLHECTFAPARKPLKNDEAFLNYMYTEELFRGKNLATYLRYKSYDILKEMGRNKIYSVTEYLNSSAVRYKEKLNADNLKLVLFIKLFNRLKWSITIRTYKI